MAEPVKDVFAEDERREAEERAAVGGDDEFEVVLGEEESSGDATDDKADDKEDDKGGDDDKSGGDDDEKGEDTDDTAGDEATDEDELLEADEDGEEDEDLTKYSKAVRKRVERERRIRRQAEESAETERAARVAAQRENLTTQKQFVEFMLTGLDQQLSYVREQLAAAKEAGDSSKEAELLVMVSDLTSKKRQAEEAKTRLDASKIDDQPSISPEARRWMSNNRWFNHPRFPAETNYARQLDAQLSKEGIYRPGSAEYMRELDRRVSEQIPDLRRRASQVFRSQSKPAPKTAATDKSKPNKQKTQVAAPVSRGAAPNTRAPATQGKSKVTLTPADQELMRSFKLDPTNKDHLKAFARERLAHERGNR